MADEKIVIEFDGDIKALKAKLSSSKKQVTGLQKAATSLKKNIGGAAKLGAVAFGLLSAAIAKSVATYRIQEQAEVKTRATIEATGSAAGLTAEQIFKMASALQNVTTYGDEAIISGQNMLLTFKNIGGDIFPRVTAAMLDMSTAMGSDLKGSAIQLGKALNDPVAGIAALSRVGVGFTAQQKDQIKAMQAAGDTAGAQGVILTELEGQFGGMARAAADGTGALIQTSNIIGDISEAVGKDALPAILLVNKHIKEMALGFDGSGLAMTLFRSVILRTLKVVAFLKSTLSSVVTLMEGNFATAAKIASEIISGNFKKAFYALGDHAKKGFAKVKDEVTAYNEAAAEIDALYSEKAVKLKRETAEKKKKIDDELEAQNKIRREEAAAAELDAINEGHDILTAAELVKLQERADAKAELAELEKVKQLQSQGQHDKALEKLKDIRDKKDLARTKKDTALKKLKAKTDIDLATSTANLITAVAGSGNKAAFLITKAAAIASAIVNTQAAMAAAMLVDITGATSTRLGIMGGINVATIAATAVKGFANGGMYDTGSFNGDALPAKLSRGEVVIPSKSFDEVVGGERARRAAEENGGLGGSQEIDVQLSFKDGVGEFIEGTILERRRLGTGAI